MRQGDVCGLLFGGVFLGCNFAKSQKMRDAGVLAKFAIARLQFFSFAVFYYCTLFTEKIKKARFTTI